MKKYHDDGLLICELTAEDVTEADEKFSLFMQCKGDIYAMTEYKQPKAEEFFNLYFGEYDDGFYVMPDRYICTNENIADRFMKLAKMLKYHDTFEQKYRDVEQDGKIIDVYDGDY